MATAEIGPEPARVADLPGRSMLILYGSETGNSQDIAEEIGRNAQRLHFKTRVDEMNGAQLVSYLDPDSLGTLTLADWHGEFACLWLLRPHNQPSSTLLQYTLVVFVISTTGQGDMPRNSGTFWKSLLRKKLPPGCLGAVRFTTFGLGDSMYIKFNWAARKLHKRLEQLGAVEFYPRGKPTSRTRMDERYMPWAADLRKKLLDLYPLPEGLAPIPDDALLPPRYTVTLASSLDTPQSQNQDQSIGGYTNGHAVGPAAQEAQPKDTQTTTAVEDLIQKTTSITITEDPPRTNGAKIPRAAVGDPPPHPGGQDASLELNERVTPETHFQDVRLVRLAIDPVPNGPPTIHPFDSLTIYPKNFPQDVQKLIDLMDWSAIADLPLSFTPASSSPPSSGQPSLPRGLHIDPCRPTTLRDLLTHNLDITCTPRRSFLKDMSYFSSDEYHRQRLLEFTMREYTDEFFDYTTRPRRTILEVLDEFTSVRIPLAHVLDMFPVMRGRDFSIASVARRPSGSPTSPDPSSPAPAPAPAATKTSVTLLIALVKYKTILRKIRQGLCSRYLESLTRPGTPLRVTLNRSSASLHGPTHARRPLCAVATGTGVAPLRLFVEERLSHASSGAAPVGDTAVFFGNRSRDADFHFRDVWEDLKTRYAAADSAKTQDPAATGGRFDVHTAFSRDPSAPRQYVQDVIRQHPSTIRAMAASDAIFVVCGGSLKMSRAVKEAVKDCLRGDAKAYPDDAAVEAAFARLTWWEEIW
ncbi:NADPH-dependent diflavin oxidoreductase 1 [Colletotrichum spaethianum]|uniref:NADPH-dependent diflavin oxidoreductase 1 n=1 Tax=Colletotrichum spaethianum TaxID=700344 RepID=A0AA37PAD1_9PEZI|nr:NADPH-dependent diflavin oxidoreductase 1 [Colletotrichum spaethianum]GKT48608.1 NADPH-dependent diflavin oxidoreductase 1 [Colletotrichum spaethianum]